MIISEQKKTITNAEDIAGIMSAILSKESELDRQKEHFWVLGTNVKNVIQYIDLVSLGILNSCNVHPRETFRLAIMKGVASIFCIHNHPGGDTKPSSEDIRVTDQLIKAGTIVGIKLLDHIIIGNGTTEHTSLRNDGNCAFL